MSVLRSRHPLSILEFVFELSVGVVALLTLLTDSRLISDLWSHIGQPYLFALVATAAVTWSGFDSGKWREWTSAESKAAGWGFRNGFWLVALGQI